MEYEILLLIQVFKGLGSREVAGCALLVIQPPAVLTTGGGGHSPWRLSGYNIVPSYS